MAYDPIGPPITIRCPYIQLSSRFSNLRRTTTFQYDHDPKPRNRRDRSSPGWRVVIRVRVSTRAPTPNDSPNVLACDRTIENRPERGSLNRGLHQPHRVKSSLYASSVDPGYGNDRWITRQPVLQRSGRQDFPCPTQSACRTYDDRPNDLSVVSCFHVGSRLDRTNRGIRTRRVPTEEVAVLPGLPKSIQHGGCWNPDPKRQ